MDAHRLGIRPSDHSFSTDTARWSDDGGPMPARSTRPPPVAGQLELAEEEWLGAVLAAAAHAEGDRYRHPWDRY